MKEFDEFDAVAHIRQRHPELQPYDDDDLLLAIDTTYDYFDSLPDDAPDSDYELEPIARYVTRQLARIDDCPLGKQPQHAQAAVEGLLDYEDTLDDILSDDENDD